jgi:hypothetical protein
MKKGAKWMCAQQRFAVAWETIGRFYRKQLEVENWALPDFLLLQDDDSHYNMVRIEDFLRDKDPSIPLAEAPCLIRIEDFLRDKDPSIPLAEAPCLIRHTIIRLILASHGEVLALFSAEEPLPI